MGRNSETFSGLFTFGIRDIKVWLIDMRSVPEIKQERTVSNISKPMLDQKV